MDIKYRELEFLIGLDIESAVKELKSYNEPVCGSFNGQMLYSDIDDVDSAYMKIMGKTKAQFDEEEKIRNKEYQEQKRAHEEIIPELTKEWIQKGNQILDSKYYESWAKCVPIRLNDLYEGMELGMCLDIVKELNNNSTFEEVETIVNNQGHSGMSFGLICSMIKSFSDRGQEFVDYIRSK